MNRSLRAHEDRLRQVPRGRRKRHQRLCVWLLPRDPPSSTSSRNSHHGYLQYVHSLLRNHLHGLIMGFYPVFYH
jgi:hypothetical protein